MVQNTPMVMVKFIEARTQIGGYGGGRYIGFVTTADNKAKIAESEDKALTRALS